MSELLTPETVRGWLDRISYKPDTELWVSSTPGYLSGVGGIVVNIRRHLPDSTSGIDTMGSYTDRSRFIPVVSRMDVWPSIMHARDPFQAFTQQLHHTLTRLELHEANEWFRVDGALPFDPHREDVR